MTIDDKIRDAKTQYDINIEAAKTSALSSHNTGKYEYLTGGKILTSNQRKIIEQPNFTYNPLGKAFEKQTKTMEEQREKTNKDNWRSRHLKTESKHFFRYRWKINRFFVFNRFSKWRSYIRIKQNYRNGE